ncbi:MAG TPA: HNH endonuclease signature motif containing protein [Blastocatellia bacterium]|nr:HNH endonuclease signature motif containing protein [Blastocatellia bacterium]
MTSYIPDAVRDRVVDTFGNRCSYCLASQRYVLSKLEIEHIIPVTLGGNNDELNLCLACRLCNLYKSIQMDAVDPVTKANVALFNPRTQAWSDHFHWSQDGAIIIGVSPIGRATVEALRLNNEIAVEVRRNWVLVGWHPPSDAR